MRTNSSRDDIAKSFRRREIILYPDGHEIGTESIGSDQPAGSGLKDSALRKYLKAISESGMHPRSVEAMRRLEMVDYEPASNAGHFRFYPEGSMILDLLIEWANEIAVERFGAMKIETPLIYDWRQKDIREQGESFHERHYIVKAESEPKKEWVLRFAGDFGLFRMMKDAKLSYRNLPLRLYELSKSFRYERRGELSGLRRLREFTMPDIHSFTSSIEDGWQEYIELFRHYDDLAKETGVEYAIVFRVVEDFYAANKSKILEMLKHSGRPALIELLSEMKHYWVIKNEFQGIDSSGGSCQLSTVQLDVVDSLRYGIVYTDRDGKEKGCVICHSSIGSIERWIYAILENAVAKKIPVLPLWLSPIQVRIIPVCDSYLDHSIRLCSEFESSGIRCDVDDREITMQKKVMHAQQKWIPFMIVLGEKEIGSDKLSVTVRRDSKKMLLSKEDLIQKIHDEVCEKPQLRLRVPSLVSRRPRFHG